MPTVPKRTRAPLESDILNQIRTRLGLMSDVRLFRNNTGMLKDSRGVPVRYGLAIGSADLIGSLDVWACPMADGVKTGPRHIARSLAIEVKRPGAKATREQELWLESVRKAGWIVGVCRSVEDAVDLIESARRWEI